MYGMYSPYQYLSSGFRPVPSPSEYSVLKQIPVYLGGKPGTEKVVIYKSNTGFKSKAEIQRYNESTNRWEIEYSKEADGAPNFLVTTGYWEIIGQNVVVLYDIEGSGGFLSYTVIGRKGGKLVEYAERKDIFQGNVWFEGGNLIESSGGRFKIWVLRNRRPALVPYKIPIIRDAYVIQYSIDRNGKVHIAKTSYTVPVGTTVQLIRTDLNPSVERVLFYINPPQTPTVKFIPHRSAYKFISAGKQEFTIIPGGYDWDKAVNVTIEVK